MDLYKLSLGINKTSNQQDNIKIKKKKKNDIENKIKTQNKKLKIIANNINKEEEKNKKIYVKTDSNDNDENNLQFRQKIAYEQGMIDTKNELLNNIESNLSNFKKDNEDIENILKTMLPKDEEKKFKNKLKYNNKKIQELNQMIEDIKYNKSDINSLLKSFKKSSVKK